MTHFTEETMLVDLTIGCWTAKKHDRKASRDAARVNNADDTAGRFIKDLLNSEKLKVVQQKMSEARMAHMKYSMPWLDQGTRIIPNTMFYEYRDIMQEKKTAFIKARDDFMPNYRAEVERRREQLGDLFSETDYPRPERVFTKFYFDLAFFPVPMSGDWRVNLNKEDVDAIKQDIDNRVATATQRATQDLFDRLYQHIERMRERLSDPDNIFKDTLVNNAKDLVELLPKMNFTNDPHLNKLIQETKLKLCAYEPDTLRFDEDVREKTAKAAEDILAKFNIPAQAA
jgi:hypothetical protein